MPFNLIAYDQSLSEKVLLAIDGEPISGMPPGGKEIHFQFPPTIKSESKKANWMLSGDMGVYEPYYIWKTMGPRHIAITATYIVGGPPTGKVPSWTSQRVAEEMRRYKSYFYTKGLEGGIFPVFATNMYEMAPAGNADPIAWRGLSVNFKYSDTLIDFPNNSGEPSPHPLRTDVTLTLEAVTNIRVSDGKTIYDYENLVSKPPQEWY